MTEPFTRPRWFCAADSKLLFRSFQRIFQLKGLQVKKRAAGFRPRIQALPSVAAAPNERWSTDLCRIWAGRDGWATCLRRFYFGRTTGLCSRVAATPRWFAAMAFARCHDERYLQDQALL